MKKYLMGGIAAVAICAAFTSCSKNNELFDQNAAEQIKQQTSEQKILDSYQKAFENAFGQPGANQDWGLAKYGGVKKASTRAPKAATVADFVFADAPTDDDFAYTAKAIPSDALLASEYGDATKGSVHNYKLEETTNTQTTNFYAGNFNLYISGTKSINYSIPGDGQKNMKIYVMPNANVTFTQNFTQKGSGELFIYVPATATVNFDGGLQAYLTLYNRGTVNIKGGYKPGLYDGGIVYNEGTFNINGAQDYYGGAKNNKNPLTLNNSDSQFINAGTLNVGAVILEGSSHFLNLGTANVSGATIVNSNQCTWVNEGTYTTGDFYYTAGSTDVRNNCKMIVNNIFSINLGDTDKNNFTNNGGASVVTENFEIQGPGYIKLGSKSLFKVNKTATMNSTKPDYGFWGPTSGDYAVLQAKDIVTPNTSNSKYVTYGGNLFVCAETHFVQQWSGQYPFYYLEDNAKIYASGTDNNFLSGIPNISIKPSKCSPGFNYDEEPSIVYTNRIMGEDLTAMSDNDFDFNDVVFDWAISADGKTAYIKLWAAGGTLPLKIGTAIGQGEEVHALFGVSESTMVNTGVGANGVTKDPVEFTITKTDGTFNSAEDIIVSVDKTSKGSNGYMQMTAKIGQAPCLLFVPLDTKWVDEYENIEKAYTWFGAWSRGQADDQWTSTPVEKFVDLDLSNNK